MHGREFEKPDGAAAEIGATGCPVRDFRNGAAWRPARSKSRGSRAEGCGAGERVEGFPSGAAQARQQQKELETRARSTWRRRVRSCRFMSPIQPVRIHTGQAGREVISHPGQGCHARGNATQPAFEATGAVAGKRFGIHEPVIGIPLNGPPMARWARSGGRPDDRPCPAASCPAPCCLASPHPASHRIAPVPPYSYVNNVAATCWANETSQGILTPSAPGCFTRAMNERPGRTCRRTGAPEFSL